MVKRKKAVDDVVNDDDILDDEASDGGGVLPYASSVKTDSARQASLGQLCTLLDVSDTTVRSWVNTEKCPFVQKADKKSGTPWIFDVPSVVRWYAQRAAAQAVERVGVTEDGIISTDEAKRRRWVALAISEEINTGEKLKEFVRVSVALERMATDYSRVRIALQAIPNAVAGYLPEKLRDSTKQRITDSIESALRSLIVPHDRDIKIQDVEADK